jgi:isoprenylcysteine carboxyl methyltransferase (ICMT) family protein YpbQ
MAGQMTWERSMHASLIIIFMAAVTIRIFSVTVSKQHERRLQAEGAVEHGAVTSRFMAVAHTIYYLTAFAEGWYRAATFDGLSAVGLVILLMAFSMLFWIVRILGRLWTVKIMIADNHPVSRHALFRYVRHPNYALNIVPELVGYALIFHAWLTLIIGLPIYLVILAIRIVQEERAMKELFAAAD